MSISLVSNIFPIGKHFKNASIQTENPEIARRKTIGKLYIGKTTLR